MPNHDRFECQTAIDSDAILHNGKYDVLSPLYSGEPVNEAEVLGAAVWLWMHSPLHRDAPLHTLPDLLLPVIKHRQYVVATEQGRPVFFMSQAWLSPEAEARFLTQPAILMPQSDWNSGDRMWVCDWVAPFGHTPDMSRLVRQDIFPRLCWRSLYHRGQQTGLRVMNFRGAQVSREEARQWRVQHPLAVDVPER